jgi:hypothetical protein
MEQTQESRVAEIPEAESALQVNWREAASQAEIRQPYENETVQNVGGGTLASPAA